VNQAARHIGKTIALVLPVVLVLSGTLAVTRVPWATSGSEAQILTAASKAKRTAPADTARKPTSPQAVLRQRLLDELQADGPGASLTDLQKEMARKPSLAKYCTSIARSLGRATVAYYGGNAYRAQKWSRPVCDTSFASGVMATS
jgi:hypothetical protein